MPAARRPDPAADLVNSQEACRILQVKPATLYTYVSRGLLHPVAQAGRKHRLYPREEVASLRARSEARMGHGAVAATALRWGQPVINTGITEITPDGPRYRGHLAADLVDYPGVFENVAELLWTGVLPEGASVWPAEPPCVGPQASLRAMGLATPGSMQMTRVFAAVATMLGGGSVDDEVRSGTLIRSARQLVFAFAGCCGLLAEARRYRALAGRKPLVEHIAAALGREPDADLLKMLNVTLILSADHELSPPTFSARIAASVGAELTACVAAALAAQSGLGLAGGCDRIEATLAGITSSARLKAWVSRVARDRARLPGFGLESYPQGDPRAAYLLRMAQSHGSQTRRSEMLFRFLDEVQAQLGIPPRIEIGLAAVSATWGLPPGSASALWGIGRSAGWIAHALEQRLNGFFLRPRGRFHATHPGAAAWR